MKNHVLLKVFIALALGIFAGWITGTDQAIGGVSYVNIYSLIGQLFLNALHLVAVPLVSASIILGAAKMASDSSFGLLGIKTFGFYLLSISLAILVGISGFFFIFSEISADPLASMSAVNPAHALPVNLQPQAGGAFETFTQILFRLIPSNILAAASQGQMLGLIVYSILFGFFLSKIEAGSASVILKFWEGIFQITMKMTYLIMTALPIGVFGLVAKVTATTGLESIASSAWYFLTAIAGLLAYSFVIIPMLLIVIAKVNPIPYFYALSPALFTAFSTSSSAATLPITLECVEKRAGVSNRICSFSIPLGTSLNMSGGALCMTVASLFIATVYGVPLNVHTIGLIGCMALLTSMGVAGIPSASLISVTLILNTIGVPVEGIGLIIAVDRILDMLRTTVNVLGNATCAVLIARSEGESLAKELVDFKSQAGKLPTSF
ncbi:dicarboxylate/amino acid:cation symporter [Candidatus Protochlamydia phocaeensis]|uniref:dicarboxylate/amino acid:cation symporter n=1 Tax=Candidatus Protochlamydia phocaeensis TaxID=1414722 RepID=UPI00083936D0|nr:dicarboxylate/amino acid:cation symporter [Candidatus Protochlamydia phocaeensis]